MNTSIIFLIIVSLAAVFVVLPRWKRFKKTKQRRQVLATPFPEHWRAILQADFSLYRRMPADLQAALEQHALVFLHEKTIIGCNGQEITDRVRVLIAAQACVLIMNKPTDYFPGFESILVYPDVYEVEVTNTHGDLRSRSVDVRAGESWMHGPIVLTWSHILHGAQDGRDGHNVVMHEFAHKLDEQTSAVNGLPLLSSPKHYRPWSQALGDAFKRQQALVRRGKKGVIDNYGATSPAEFFAVLTETFFEKPRQLQRHHPALYEQLQQLYQLDPVAWYNN